MSYFLKLFLALIVGHFICDYPLQGDFLARGKNHKQPLPGVPWWQCLFAHAAIHGGMVAIIVQAFVPGAWWLGLFEFLFHALTDAEKCEGVITFNKDQFLHLWCKACWTISAIILWRFQ